MIAGRADRKNPTIGSKTNSSGNRNCFILETFFPDGRFLKSITIIASVAKRHDVNIKPASRGRLYPSEVLVKTGFIKGMMFAATVMINQFTGQRKWSRRT